MDLLTRLESQLLAQLQDLPASHPFRQLGRQPIYANELQRGLTEAGLAPLDASVLSPLLRRLPPRGLDTCLDVSRFMSENAAIVDAGKDEEP
ncbi:unnamed protein product, partial [Amoebophrya sp. A25]|eukprot:GSA25T00016706001.1